MSDPEFLAGLLEQIGTPCVTKEDFDGPHGDVLRRWQAQGAVGHEASHFRAAGCPHCDAGVPHLLGGRYLCNVCRSRVDPGYLLLWTVDLRAFLAQVAHLLRLHGGVRPIVDRLWQLGTGRVDEGPVECFYRRRGPLAADEEQKLRAFRRLVVFHGPLTAPDAGSTSRWVPLVELFDREGLRETLALQDLLRVRGPVRFDVATGSLRVGGTWLGEVPLWSREFFFLACLFERLDQFVPYEDLKRDVLQRTGGRGGPDDATFCHKLRSRIKKAFIPGIDRLIVTSNKADGYRLRAEGEA